MISRSESRASKFIAEKLKRENVIINGSVRTSRMEDSKLGPYHSIKTTIRWARLS